MQFETIFFLYFVFLIRFSAEKMKNKQSETCKEFFQQKRRKDKHYMQNDRAVWEN